MGSRKLSHRHWCKRDRGGHFFHTGIGASKICQCAQRMISAESEYAAPLQVDKPSATTPVFKLLGITPLLRHAHAHLPGTRPYLSTHLSSQNQPVSVNPHGFCVKITAVQNCASVLPAWRVTVSPNCAS